MDDLSHVSTEALEAELERRAHRVQRRGRQRWRCRTCGLIFQAGDPGPILFAEHGRFWCYACTEDFRQQHQGTGATAILLRINQVFQGYGEMLAIEPLGHVQVVAP